MKLHTYAVLKESLKSARTKYVDTGKVAPEDLEELAEMDFTKTKKYLEWLCKVYIGETRLFGVIGVSGMVELLHTFEKAIQSKFEIPNNDINTYSLQDLKKIMDDFIEYLNSKKKKKSGAELFFENDKCYIYNITSYDAARIYGAHTRWCVTMRDTSNYWDEYSLFNLFLFLVSKQDSEKYALVINLYQLQKYKKNFDMYRVQTFNMEDDDVSTENDKVFDMFDIDYKKFLNTILTKVDVDEVRKNKVDKIAKYYRNDLQLVEGNTYNILSNFRMSHAFYDVGRGEFIINFNKCDGDFFINGFRLKTLKGCPKYVNGSFGCIVTDIINLVGGPEEVEGNYTCEENVYLTSLRGCATKIGGRFTLKYNNLITSIKDLKDTKKIKEIELKYLDKLQSLEGLESMDISRIDIETCNSLEFISELKSQQHLDEISIRYCNALKSLQGLEKVTVDTFSLGSASSLKNFIGMPKQVSNLRIYKCPGLTSLEGLPKEINGVLYLNLIDSINLTTLKGLPQKVKGITTIYLPKNNTPNIQALFNLKVENGGIQIFVSNPTSLTEIDITKLKNIFGSKLTITPITP